MDKKAIILIGHGSRHPYNHEVVSKIASYIKKSNNWDSVSYCFNEMNKPSITDALNEECKDKNITTIVFAPVFIAAGAHIKEDIPKALGLTSDSTSATREINGVARKIILSGPIGADEGLAAIIENKALSLL